MIPVGADSVADHWRPPDWQTAIAIDAIINQKARFGLYYVMAKESGCCPNRCILNAPRHGHDCCRVCRMNQPLFNISPCIRLAPLAKSSWKPPRCFGDHDDLSKHARISSGFLLRRPPDEAYPGCSPSPRLLERGRLANKHVAVKKDFQSFWHPKKTVDGGVHRPGQR